MQFDKIIQNGTVVTATDTYQADVGIKGEKITSIAERLAADLATEVIDAKGRYLFPGGIDVHTHLDMPLCKITSKDDFLTGTIAAACGGTTTIVDFSTQEKGHTLQEAVDTWHRKAEGKAVIDYGFHIAVADLNEAILAEMVTMIGRGYPSFKLYMTYKDLRINDEGLLRALECCRDHGGLVSVHAENFHAINYFTAKFKHAHQLTPEYHPLSRPPLVEGEAVGRAIKLARMIDAPIYIVHVTCNEALDEIVKARTSGAKVMAETCPQYLLLADDKYHNSDFESAKYVISPPLRSIENQEILWRGLADSNLLVVASDHCPFDFKGQKELGRNFFGDIPNGAAGIELRMALLFDRGVNARRIDLQKYVAITATNPAKIFGLAPQKGSIAVGSDADLVIFDPNLKKTITKKILHENVDYTPYEGLSVTGFPVMTLSRGQIVAQAGEFVGKIGAGKFLPRKNISIL